MLYSWRSFEAYPGLVTVSGATSVTVPNLADGRHDLPAMAAAITDRTRVVLVCSPNNPTGGVVTAAEFSAFMAEVPADLLVLLDEAYAEFVRDDAAVDGHALVGMYPNLVILRTFSKAWGLAGLRLGYAIGPERVLDAARAAAIPLSVTGPAQAAGAAALDHEAELVARVEHIIARRSEVRSALLEAGLPVLQSQGNFVWLPLAADAEFAADILNDHGLVTRAFPGDGVRVSIGEAESVQKLKQAAVDIVENLPTRPETSRID